MMTRLGASSWQGMCEALGAFSQENRKQACESGESGRARAERGGAGEGQPEEFGFHSKSNEESLKFSAGEKQHQMSKKKGSLRMGVQNGGHGGRTDVGIQGNPAVAGQPPQWARRTSAPAGSPRKDSCSQCREGFLRFLPLPDSLGRKATDLPHPRREPYRIYPGQWHRAQALKEAALPHHRG